MPSRARVPHPQIPRCLGGGTFGGKLGVDETGTDLVVASVWTSWRPQVVELAVERAALQKGDTITSDSLGAANGCA